MAIDMALAKKAAIAQGFEKAASNFINIKAAQEKLNREEDLFKKDKKIKELQIDKAEYFLSPEQLEMERKRLKAETDAKRASIDLAKTQIKETESKTRREMEEHKNNMSLIDTILEKGINNLPYGTSVRAGNVLIRGTKDDASGNQSVNTLINQRNAVADEMWWNKKKAIEQ